MRRATGSGIMSRHGVMVNNDEKLNSYIHQKMLKRPRWMVNRSNTSGTFCNVYWLHYDICCLHFTISFEKDSDLVTNFDSSGDLMWLVMEPTWFEYSNSFSVFKHIIIFDNNADVGYSHCCPSGNLKRNSSSHNEKN